MLVGTAEDAFDSSFGAKYRGSAQLIFTSPPFPLNRKKKYGNLQGEEYVKWLSSFGSLFRDMLVPDGSVVIELGNAWEPGHPVMSTLALRALLGLLDAGDFFLCQQFIRHNPARLPSPAQWVNVERIRVKDSFTHVWWMSPSERPKADNTRVLKEYSASMRKLLDSKEYNAGRRPSQHKIGEKSFLRDNRGTIPSNVLTFANTSAIDPYQDFCRNHRLKPRPARMPSGLPEFFIRMLTDRGEMVLDAFAGSCVTGEVAERLAP